MSPKSIPPLELVSNTLAVFVVSSNGFNVIITIVGSSTVFPSTSFPLSLVSETLLLWPGLLAVTFAEFIILPVSISDWVTI